MAVILSDNQIESLLGKVILNGDLKLINPNSIKLRLGKHIFFHSTEEEFNLERDEFVVVQPGETISFTSYESIDFSKAAVDPIFPNCSLLAFVTPTTTMMREGISQSSTKIDVGFKGILNWSLRNGSSREIILQAGEPMFKLTIFKLSGDEIPSFEYGDREQDSYQNSDGIAHSSRNIPARIPKNKLVKSSIEKIDPKKQLKEAGYPFNYIGTELTELQGKFELVSKDMLLIKEEFSKTTDLLSKRIEDTKDNLILNVQALFKDNFLKIAGIILGAVPIFLGLFKFFQKTELNNNVQSICLILFGIIVIVIVFIITRNFKKK